jgi:5-methylcytosine-specific restriction endonuclease McrA
MKYLIFLVSLFVFCTYSSAQSRYISKTTKKIVYNRDKGICRCCGSTQDLEFDHITPYSCGGTSEVSNIQLLCFTCNRSKSNSCYCKVHNRKVGSNCCDKKTNKKPTSTLAKQCSGTTKKGARCKNRTTNKSGRCHLH